MEKTNIEIERFKKKAEHYKKALNLCPDARILEIFNIISIIDGYIKDNELDKSTLCIVDLMSGDGYLTKYLYKMGFRNIHAFEACNEMSFNSENYNVPEVRLHPIPDILEIEKILCNLNPKIIISLASFHHLIITDNQPSNSINTIESLNLQQKVIDLSMRYLDEDGLFLIADIYNNASSTDEFITDIPFWSTDESYKLLDKAIHDNDIELIKKSTNQANLSSIIDDKLTNFSYKRNPSINWFRQVVKKETTIGHDDFAISKDLIEYIKSKHTYKYNTFACPWIFDNQELLKNFILNKFGFVLDNGSKISDEDVLKKANEINGITSIKDGKALFGWNLSVLLLSKTNSIFKKKTNKKRVAFILLLLLVVLVANILMNLHFKLYNKDLINITNSLSYLLLGYLLPDAISYLSKLIFRKKNN